MRLFTAIELPQNIRAHLVRIAGALQNHRDLKDALSFTREDNFHITLKFLGDNALSPDDGRFLLFMCPPRDG